MDRLELVEELFTVMQDRIFLRQISYLT